MTSGLHVSPSDTGFHEPASDPGAEREARTRGMALTRPLGFLGMLALVLTIELFLAFHNHDYRDAAQWNFDVSWREARNSRGNYEVICLGDSVIKMGVVPQVLEKKLGSRVYNMGVCGSQAPETFFLLRRVLESGARPRAILVNFLPRLQELGPWHSASYWMFTGLRDTLELCWTARDATLLGVILTKRILPSYALRDGIRGEVMGSFKGQPGQTRRVARVFRTKWARDHGAQLMGGKPTSEDFVEWRKGYFSRRWFEPTNVAFIHRFLKLAAAYEIPVFWLITPVKAGLQVELEKSGFDLEYSRYLRAIGDRFPNVTMVDGRHSGMEPELFFDPHHLNTDGARIYSAELGEIVRKHLDSDRGSDRWVSLVARKAGSSHPPVAPNQQDAVAAIPNGSSKRRN